MTSQKEKEQLILFSTDENICESHVRRSPDMQRSAAIVESNQANFSVPPDQGITSMLD